MMAQDSAAPKSAATAIAGQWQMSLQTPHGPMKAGLQVKQDGAKISGTCDIGPHGVDGPGRHGGRQENLLHHRD